MFISLLAQKLWHQMQIYDIYPIRKFWESASSWTEIIIWHSKKKSIFTTKNDYRKKSREIETVRDVVKISWLIYQSAECPAWTNDGSASTHPVLCSTDKETDESWDIFIIWKINSGLVWAAGQYCEKKFGADYEQLLRLVF